MTRVAGTYATGNPAIMESALGFPSGAIKYVGRGDAPARLATHAESIDKGDLIGEVLWTNNLSKAQAKGIEIIRTRESECCFVSEFGDGSTKAGNVDRLGR